MCHQWTHRSLHGSLESLPVKAVGAKLDRKVLESQTKDRHAMMRSLQLNFETHMTASNAGHPPTSFAH